MTRTHITPARAAPRPYMHTFQRHIWQYKVLLETTFGISVLEPWERLVFLIVVFLVAFLFVTGCVRYLPYVPLQLARLQHRLAYYLWGSDEVSTLRRVATDVAAMREL